jgi:hypothetical protein
VSEKNDELIRQTVQDCLGRCYRGTTPLGEIASFAGELRARGWSDEDVRTVETAVRRILAGVMTNGTEAEPSA